MLGEHLIRNERVALVELIKNSYDADADSVKVCFRNFNDDMSSNEESSIVVEDNGSGMTPAEIKNAWMNPATPQKYLKKKAGNSKTPEKHRTIQGEKGIGRFALFKLGKVVSITTRAMDSNTESFIKYDFSKFDDDFTEKEGYASEIFLDQIQVEYRYTKPKKIRGHRHGTIIEIDELRSQWNGRLIDNLCSDISNLTDPVSRVSGKESTDDFQISVYCNGHQRELIDEGADDLRALIENKAALKINGTFDSNRTNFSYVSAENGEHEEKLSLSDPKLQGLLLWKQKFKDSNGRDYECGSFKFHFYIFNFSAKAGTRYYLNKPQKDLLKKHRIYLYRDNIRVYPYGDPDDDWLGIDIHRGVARAGDYFSNDQIVGWIDISQRDNPNLRDKTNREGLIEKGRAVSDFIDIIQVFLSYIKQSHYLHYLRKDTDKGFAGIVRSKILTEKLVGLESRFRKNGDKNGVRDVRKSIKIYEKERGFYTQRAEALEDLAGVGLSVEMTSHDIMLMIGRARDIAKKIARLARSDGGNLIQEQADILLGTLSQVADNMQDIQTLFRSTKRRRRRLKIEPILDKIEHIYSGLLDKNGIQYRKCVPYDSPLMADIVDGVVMQVLINLFDNSIYWLDSINEGDREIVVRIDSNRDEMVFADSGPGIDEDDLPYIFQPFYSSKGQEGRGLGLYIASQLLDRYGYSISVDESKRGRILPGANFRISFLKENE